MWLQIAADSTLLASSGEGDVGLVAALFLLSGPAFFVAVFMAYRNTDKRHRHEEETHAEIENVASYDQKVRKLRGVSNGKMSGSNHRKVTHSRGWF